MSLKDKILIAIIIIGVIIIGICLHSTATLEIGGININCERELAENLTNQNKETLIMTDVQNNWFNLDNLKVHEPQGLSCGCNVRTSTIDYYSAYCVEHQGNDLAGASSQMVNVIDIRWNSNDKKYDTNIWIGTLGNSPYAYKVDGYEADDFARIAYAIGHSENDGYKESGPYGGVVSRILSNLVHGTNEIAGYTDFARNNGFNEEFCGTAWDNAGSGAIGGYEGKWSEVNSYSPDKGKALEKVENETEKPNANRDAGYVILGPFQMNLYNGNKVTDINISDGNNSLKAGDQGGIEYCANYGDAGAIWSNQISNIPSGQKFYIRIHDQYNTYNGTNWEATFISATAPTYNARMFLTIAADEQNKLFFAAKEIGDSVTYKLSSNIDEPGPGSLKVIKYGDNESNPQSKVNFYLGSGDKWFYKKSGSQEREENGFPTHLDDGSGFKLEDFELREWNTDEVPYIWTTNSKGELNFKGLNSKDTYELFEAYNDNKGYSNYNIEIKDVSMSNELAIVKVKEQEKNIVEGIKLNPSIEENVLKIIDKPGATWGNDFNIKIIKYRDEFAQGNRAKGAEFKISIIDKYTNYGDRSFLSEVNGQYRLDKWSSKTTTFKTDENGEINLNRIK